MPSRTVVRNQRIADLLAADGLIEDTEKLRALEFARSRGRRMEEALLELDIIDEQRLLKYIARLHRTQYVSTERLSRAKIDRAGLRLVPVNLADLHGIYPLVFEQRHQRLVVATADPDDVVAIDEVKMVSRVSDVRAMVARPAAVRAAIARGYRGDKNPFRELERTATGSLMDLNMADPFREERPAKTKQEPPARRKQTKRSRDAVPTGPGAKPKKARPKKRPTGGRPTGEQPTAAAPAKTRPAKARPSKPRRPPPPRRSEPELLDSELLDDDQADGDTSPPGSSWLPKAPAAEPELPRRQEASTQPPRPRPAPKPAAAAEAVETMPPAAPVPVPSPVAAATTVSSAIRAPASLTNVVAPRSRRAVSVRPPPASQELAVSAPFVEVIRVLVSVLESDREELRGHSSLVARLTRAACERIGLPESDATQLVIAAYLHDLGKRGNPRFGRRREDPVRVDPNHLTPLNVARFESARTMAEKLVTFPEQVMESVGLPAKTLSALHCMYEQVNGRGLPKGLSGADIPIGGRILAVADTYADLTENPRNPYHELLAPEPAINVLREHADTVFDSNIVEVFAKAMTGEEILTELLADRHRVLIVDPDPEETMMMQLRLTELGFDVQLARGAGEARAALKARDFALVVSEIDLEEPEAGLFLREEVAKMKQGQNMSWVFLTARSSGSTARRAFDLEVDEFRSKPVPPEILVAKLVQLVERSASRVEHRGVSGSLSDMAFAELVQVLWHGHRTCALHLESGAQSGAVHFREGQVVDAIWGQDRGEDAFYRMIGLGDEGQFRVDPDFVPEGEATIVRSPEGLLLEGMRRLDEGLL